MIARDAVLRPHRTALGSRPTILRSRPHLRQMAPPRHRLAQRLHYFASRRLRGSSRYLARCRFPRFRAWLRFQFLRFRCRTRCPLLFRPTRKRLRCQRAFPCSPRCSQSLPWQWANRNSFRYWQLFPRKRRQSLLPLHHRHRPHCLLRGLAANSQHWRAPVSLRLLTLAFYFSCSNIKHQINAGKCNKKCGLRDCPQLVKS